MVLVRVNAFFYAFHVPSEVLRTYDIPRDGRVRLYRGPRFAYLVEHPAEGTTKLRRCCTCGDLGPLKCSTFASSPMPSASTRGS